MKKAILLIDGENFLHKIEQILKEEGINAKKINKSKIKLDELITNVFKDYKDIDIIEKRYYAAKIHLHKETLAKSKELINNQRILKSNLENRGFDFIISGHVRAHFIQQKGKVKGIFKEKGVDVKVAVDMVALACDQLADTIILCSSDSDLQPAVKEARKRNIEVIYLGFSIDPNKGLSQTTNETILFRNPEIIKVVTL